MRPTENKPGATQKVVPTTLSQAEITALVGADHGDPFAVLGPHRVSVGTWEVRAMLPEADAARLLGADGQTVLAPMVRVHTAGLFVARLGQADRPDYRLQVERAAGTEVRHDPYAFFAAITDDEIAALKAGDTAAYPDILGARPTRLGEIDGFRFAVWAPNARRVSVIADFNDWDGRCHPMRLRHDVGVWELFVPGLSPGMRYKYEIRDAHGNLHFKADPLALAAEAPPATASVLHGPLRRPAGDDAWLDERGQAGDPRRRPMAVYECHLGSWARVPEEGNRYLTYRELSERLLPYVRDLGFTHIELLPITEYPFDGSWGYQPVSLFAPTRRFGTPEDFADFVAAAHANGIGLILDWVPGHFPNDPHGLADFDGTELYEHADPRQGFHLDWGTYIYNYGRDEVRTFLTASARFWLERYHLDGLRVDAVASMLYLDYSRQPGEWVPNRYGGNENLEAIAFLRQMNHAAYTAAPGIVTIAEESTAWPGVSRPPDHGGLGFGFKWNMGWMHDTLRYMQYDPVHRRFHHHDLTFGMLYAFSENYILPLSHDEVVHGKGSLLGRMPGDRWQRFANLRAYYGFMWGHPGKKLLFMGGEFAQEREWDHDTSLDWHLTGDPFHAGVQRLVRDLNGAHRTVPALHERDCEPEGFEWIVSDDAANSVLAFLRQGSDAEDIVIVVCNLTPVPREGYAVGVPRPGIYREIINTDASAYGGSGVGNLGAVEAREGAAQSRPYHLSLTLPPLATLFLRRIRP